MSDEVIEEAPVEPTPAVETTVVEETTEAVAETV